MRLGKLLGTLALALGLLLPGVALAADDVEGITGELLCQCGCTMIVNVCDCDTANQIRQVVRDKLAAGQTRQQIMDNFVGQYGEKVLGSPKKEGFNLTAYVLPFAAITAGGGAISAAVLAWARRGRRVPPDEEAASEPAGGKVRLYGDELEQDLAAYDREEAEE